MSRGRGRPLADASAERDLAELERAAEATGEGEELAPLLGWLRALALAAEQAGQTGTSRRRRRGRG